MYTIRTRKQLRLMDYPGRIPFHHLWGCFRMYLKLPKYEDEWEVVEYGEWGHSIQTMDTYMNDSQTRK
jgi:hypothetical protein